MVKKIGVNFHKIEIVILLVSLTTMISISGFYDMFIQLRSYDDEGAILYVLKNFIEGHILYDQVYTQYGPGYYFSQKFIMSVFHLSPTHNSTRIISLFFWIFGSFTLSLGVYRLTRNSILTAIALLMSFTISSAITNEPGHPQALLYALISLGVFLISYLPNLWAIGLLGAICGLCLMTKINIGIFLLGGLGWALLSILGKGKKLKLLQIIWGLGILVMPFALMHQRSSDILYLIYMGLATTININLLLTSPYRFKKTKKIKKNNLIILGLFAGSVVTICLLIIVLTLLQGTTILGLYKGLIIQPLGFDNIFRIEPPFDKNWSVWIILLSIVTCYFFTQWRPITPNQKKRFFLSIMLAKVLFIVVLAYIIINQYILGLNLGGFIIPWIWLVMLPQPRLRLSFRQNLRRYSLLAIATLQFMVGFPVAGSQQAWSIIFILPVAALICVDVIQYFLTFSWCQQWLQYAVYGLAYCVLISVLILPIYKNTLVAKATYSLGKSPVVLKGSSLLRLPEPRLAILEGLTLNINNNAKALLTIPGLYSFSLWSGIDSPTLLNNTNWAFALDAQTQQQLVQQFSPIPKLMVLRNQQIQDFWSLGREIPSRPLIQYINNKFVTVVSMAGYDLLVRKSEIQSFRGIGISIINPQQIKLSASNLKAVDNPSTRLAMISLPILNTQLSGFQVENLSLQKSIPIKTFSDGASLGVLDTNGELVTLDPASLKFKGLSLTQPRQVIIPLGIDKQSSPRDFYVIRGLGASGDVLFRLPFLVTSP